jgi:putative membrane protein
VRGPVVIAHHGPVAPAEWWTSWNWDPLIWSGLVGVGVAYWWAAARVGGAGWRRRCFVGGLAVAGVALISPLDAMSESLGSAHMVQHVVLTMIAAPLLVLGATMRTLLRALPPTARRRTRRWRSSRLGRWGWRVALDPVLTAGIFVVVLWTWHASGPYEAALGDDVLHGLEHATFLAAALLSWGAILHAGRRRGRSGIEVLVLFALSLQCGLLGLLLTFAGELWYPSYAATTEAWGLSPLGDQQLAGVIMWVPAGGIYVVAALLLLRQWIVEPASRPPAGRRELGAVSANSACGRPLRQELTESAPSPGIPVVRVGRRR